MKMQVAMKAKKKEVADSLMRYLANTYSLYLMTQNGHWNLTSPSSFYAIHIMLEKQYLELAEALDEIAEHIRALGFYVAATFPSLQKLSQIAIPEKKLEAKKFLHKLLQGHELTIRELTALSLLAEKNHDFATVDLVGRRLNAHEKISWMIRSSL